MLKQLGTRELFFLFLFMSLLELTDVFILMPRLALFMLLHACMHACMHVSVSLDFTPVVVLLVSVAELVPVFVLVLRLLLTTWHS